MTLKAFPPARPGLRARPALGGQGRAFPLEPRGAQQGPALSEADVNWVEALRARQWPCTACSEHLRGCRTRPQGRERLLDPGPGGYSRRLAGAVAAAFSTAESLVAAMAMGLGT